MEKLEQEVRSIIQKNSWLVLSTITPNGAPSSSVVLYASVNNRLYVLTGKGTLKAKHIQSNAVESNAYKETKTA